MGPRDLVTSCFVMMTFAVSPFSTETVIEYCQFEFFNATCGEGTLVMMTSARYGRMKVGRCLDTDAHLGCSTDVLIFMDSQCSGKPSCSLQLPVNALYRQQNCPKDVYAYLEASFTCVTVSGLESRSCTNSDSIRITQLEEGHLSSYSSQVSMQGTQSCPWKIFVKPGQRIKLTLYDFSVANRYKAENDQSQRGFSALESGHHSKDYCHVYATVNEPDLHQNKKTNVCARNSREHEAYFSSGNQVVVEVSELVVVDPTISFIIRFKAIGCPNYQPPKHAWAERSEDKLIVKCNATQQSWHMICRGTNWVGQASECDQDFPVGEKVVDDGVFPTYGLVIAVIVGIFVGSLCGFVLLAIVLWCRRQTSGRNLSSPPFDREVELCSSDTMDENNICKIHRLPTGEYGYTHVWKVRNTQLPLAPQHQQQQQHCLQQHYSINNKQLQGDCCSKVFIPSRQASYSSSQAPDSPIVMGEENMPQSAKINEANMDLRLTHVKHTNCAKADRRQRCQRACLASKKHLQQLDVIDNTNNYIRDCPLFDERFLINNNNNNNNGNSRSCEMLSFKPVNSLDDVNSSHHGKSFHPCDVAMTSLNPDRFCQPVKVDEH